MREEEGLRRDERLRRMEGLMREEEGLRREERLRREDIGGG